MKVFAVALLLLAAPALAQEEGEQGKKSGTKTSFHASLARFSSYYDGTERRSLDRAYSQAGQQANGVTLDAIVLSFDGRYDLGGGVGAGMAFPLVRASRGGRRQVVLASESLFAESIAMGDLVADVVYRKDVKPASFGAKAFLQIPTGAWDDLDASQMPTGGGAWGLGGEASAEVRVVPFLSFGGAAGAAMRMERKDGLDRGDPMWLRAWGAFRFGQTLSAGATLSMLRHGGDTIDGAKVTAMPADVVFGAPSPAMSLLSIAPWVELTPSASTRVRLSISDAGTGWLFFPAETGIPVSGENVLAADLLLMLAVSADF